MNTYLVEYHSGGGHENYMLVKADNFHDACSFVSREHPHLNVMSIRWLGQDYEDAPFEVYVANEEKSMYIVVYDMLPVSEGVPSTYSMTTTDGPYTSYRNAYRAMAKHVKELKTTIEECNLSIQEEQHGNIGSETEWFSLRVHGYEKPFSFDIVKKEIKDESNIN